MMTEAPPGEAAAGRHPLGHRDFRLFLGGSVISWVGDWMDLAALNWAVLAMTGSPFDVGIVNFCRLMPVFLLSIPAGILADRHDRRRLLLGLQAGLMLLTFVVGWLFAVAAPFWAFVVAVSLRSSLAAMVLPIRAAWLPSLVDRQAQGTAVAIQTAGMSLARIIGPAIAGWLLAVTTVERVFWINGASFVAVLATTLAVRSPGRAAPGGRKKVTAELAEAVGFLRQNRFVQGLLLLAVVPMACGFPYTALLPLFARDLWGVGPEGFGLLLSAAAAGALAGSLWLSTVARPDRVGRRLVGAIILFGSALLAAALATHWGPALVAMAVAGWSSQSYRTLSRIAIQAETPDALRGRMLSIALLDRGFIPLGALALSGVAELAGTRVMGIVMGLGCIGLTLLVMLRDRRILRL